MSRVGMLMGHPTGPLTRQLLGCIEQDCGVGMFMTMPRAAGAASSIAVVRCDRFADVAECQWPNLQPYAERNA